MDGNHMQAIVSNLIEYVLTNTKFDKPFVRERLADMGWTDDDLRYFNVDWMFRTDYNISVQLFFGFGGNMSPERAEQIADDIAEMTEAWYINGEECTLAYLHGFLAGLDEADSYCNIRYDEYCDKMRKYKTFEEFMKWINEENEHG